MPQSLLGPRSWAILILHKTITSMMVSSLYNSKELAVHFPLDAGLALQNSVWTGLVSLAEPLLKLCTFTVMPESHILPWSYFHVFFFTAVQQSPWMHKEAAACSSHLFSVCGKRRNPRHMPDFHRLIPPLKLSRLRWSAWHSQSPWKTVLTNYNNGITE